MQRTDGMRRRVAALVCTFAVGALAQGMGGGGMGGGTIDPPVGAALREPPVLTNLSATPGTVEVSLEARLAPVNVNGVTATLMTYNGCYPGPTLRARNTDRLKVRYRNALPLTTNVNALGFQRNVINLHTHGLHVSPMPPSDAVMYRLYSGQSVVHEYDLSRQAAGTLNLYHPHGHGCLAEQYWAGLVGALIVEDPDDRLAQYETRLLVLKDIALSGTNPAPHSAMSDYMMGKEGDIVTVNGQVNPRLYVASGQVQRWRILNASNARFYRLAVEGHTLQVIGTDGGLLDRPYAVSELLLSPAERVDVLVAATQASGQYRLRALPYARRGMMASSTITLMTLTYSGTRSPAQGLPATVNPGAVRLDPASVPVAADQTFTLSMSMGAGYINGHTADVDMLHASSGLGTYERWTLVNASNMDHPFHQHVNAAQVLSVSGGSAAYAALYTSAPAWKDTVLVPAGGSVKLLVPVLDYAGPAMMHCHIIEHEDIGMLAMWDIADAMMPMAMDMDGDGMSDDDEAAAGTNPMDWLSVLKVLSLGTAAAGGKRVTFPSVAGRSYRLQRCEDLRAPVWQNAEGLSTFQGTGGEMTVVHQNVGRSGFYRISVVSP